MKFITCNPPPKCGRRLIPQIVDELSETEPNRVLLSVPKTSDLADGYTDINYKDFAAAVNRFAHYLDERLGKGSPPQTIFYIGVLDMRYLVMLLAAVKTGHKAFMSSHRNSLEAHLSLLDSTHCHTIVQSENAPVITRQILVERPMDIIQMPSMELLLSPDKSVKPYPFVGTYDQRKDETCVILHTSGSTGIPKPVYVTHGTFACNDAHQLIPSLGGRPTTVHVIHQKRMFLAFPLFHACGINFTLGYAVYANMVCVLPPPGPLTADLVDKVHTYGKVDGSLIPPSVIIDIYNEPSFRANMIDRLEFLAYVGGTLPKEIGTPLSSHLQLLTLMGSTETMLLPVEVNDNNEDWEYIPISPYLGAEFREDRDGLRELVVVRNPKYELFQGVFSTFPAENEYAMHDLYAQHPDRPNAWLFQGRADDIIAFNNAEKLNPVTMETVIAGHPAVKSAIIGGHGEFQASLLIEPRLHPQSEVQVIQLIKSIWPVIVAANKGCPAHGRIMKDFIMFTKPDKPMPRAGKDTVQRFATLKLYADEFKELYRSRSNDPHSDGSQHCNNAVPTEPQKLSPAHQSSSSQSEVPHQEAAQPVSNPTDLDASIEAALNRLLPGALQQHLGPALGQVIANLVSTSLAPPTSNAINLPLNPVESLPKSTCQADVHQIVKDAITDTTYLTALDEDMDFFLAGLDSLQLNSLVKGINSSLAAARPDLEPIDGKTIYNNPDIRKLTTAINTRSV